MPLYNSFITDVTTEREDLRTVCDDTAGDVNGILLEKTSILCLYVYNPAFGSQNFNIVLL